jgi:hypothetical protein
MLLGVRGGLGESCTCYFGHVPICNAAGVDGSSRLVCLLMCCGSLIGADVELARENRGVS